MKYERMKVVVKELEELYQEKSKLEEYIEYSEIYSITIKPINHNHGDHYFHFYKGPIIEKFTRANLIAVRERLNEVLDLIRQLESEA